MKSEIDPDNIISQKRQRVASIDGIWSLITTHKLKGIFYSKNEEPVKITKGKKKN